MKILYKVLTAVVAQLQSRGGVLHEDAAYWLGDLKKASSEVGSLEDRLAAAEEKIEFLAEHVGLKPPTPVERVTVPEELYEDEEEEKDPRFD
jgi:hypothetical protein